jgi:formiminotetrahydrofolate cyclodeaminase
MDSYSDLYLRDVLDAFAAAAPAPGGGSAAALTGALGVSLLLMAVSIRMSKTAESPDPSELTDAAGRLRSLRTEMTALVDRDAEAYTAVLAAVRMPRSDEAARIRRQEAHALAMRTATDVPLETMRTCCRALRDASVVASQAVRSTHSDVGVAIELLRAAVRAAGITIDANLDSSEDVEYAARVRDERRQLESEGAADANDASSRLSD